MKTFIAVMMSLIFASNIALAVDSQPTAQPAGQPEWMKHTVPGEGHKMLNDMVGSWKINSKWWMKPGDKPMTSEGKATNKMIMEGRFLQQDVTGTMGGQPFTGMAITGHDNMKGTYQSIWIDNMSTAMGVTNGTADSRQKTLTEKGTMSDAMSNIKDKPFRMETKIKNKNTMTMTMFCNGPEGKEFKCSEMNYTRM